MMKKLKALTTAGKMTLAGVLVLVLALGTVVTGAFIKVDPNDPNSESVTASVFGSIVRASDGKDTTSADEISEGDVKAFVNWAEELPDVDAEPVTSVLEEHFKKGGHIKGNDGSWLVQFSTESAMDTDTQAPFWGQQAGLVSYQIDEAYAKNMDLTEGMKNAVLSLNVGDTASMSDEELDNLREQLFQAFLGNPILFEGYVRLLCDQHIGQTERFGDHWFAGQRFLNTYDQARAEGKGLNVWLRKVNGVHYTNSTYHKYVAAVILMLTSRETEVVRLVANPNDHYSLIRGGDFTSLRMASPANYSEDLPSLSFIFRLKNGKIALRLGANLIDKRPEVLNYTVMTKEVAATYTPAPARKKSGGGSSDGGSTPEPFKPTPGPTPGPDPTPEGKKNPSDDAPNAITDWNDDDPGPGPHKPDIGNSKSPTVEGSQAKPNTVTNTNGGDSSKYPTGPSADGTDNGGTPDTSKPENKVGNGAGTGVTSGTANGQAAQSNGVHDGRTNFVPGID